jgi:hypothetical protein
MPIKNSSNNRVLPNNARAVDVAKASVRAIAPVQARRYDAAFRVQGYSGILYTRLTNGSACSCCNQSSAASSLARLDQDGKAEMGVINALLTGKEFSTGKPIGQVAATTPQAKQSMLEIAPIGYRRAGIAYPDRSAEPVTKYDSDGPTRGYVASTASDHWSSSGDQAGVSTVVTEGVGPNGPVSDSQEVEEMLVPTGSLGFTDASCPICFGSGFVGGYSVFKGWRRVLVPNAENCFSEGMVDMLSNPWTIDSSCEWRLVLPMGVVSVDSLRVFRDDRTVFSARIFIDGQLLTEERHLMRYCDGKSHLLAVHLPEGESLSHVELQVNQSIDTANFEFPRRSKNADMSLLERTDPFQLVFSPLIPILKTQDVIVESVSGSVLQVKECTSWNDARASVLGWEANVRPTQPFEIFHLLPKRAPLSTPRVVSHVVDNSYGNRRT